MTLEHPAQGNRRLEFLESVNQMLDELVKQRTLDLVSANRRLLEEIATRKEAEQKLERSRDELRSIAEHLQRAIGATERGGRRRGRHGSGARRGAHPELTEAAHAERDAAPRTAARRLR